MLGWQRMGACWCCVGGLLGLGLGGRVGVGGVGLGGLGVEGGWGIWGDECLLGLQWEGHCGLLVLRECGRCSWGFGGGSEEGAGLG